MMKRMVLSGLAAVMLASCIHASLAEKIDGCAADVEDNFMEWTEEDWQQARQRYEQLLEEYQENYKSYSKEEKDEINRAIGRYNGMLVKRGIKDSEKVLKDLGERVPSMIEGFMSAFGVEE